ncbi:MAG: exodeoxyribonuclease V subunit gamma [Desulfobacterales bacterium]|nr:exodeoxyribonuclease V subunit gamma [Desulfobacterales bacterium]
MLNLIKSNRMEDLVEALCTVVAQVPADPMTPEVIGIQSRGMKQWLTTAIAGRFGICANVKFVFPREILELAMGQPDNRNSGEAVLTREMMLWKIMDILLSGTAGEGVFKAPGGPYDYVRGDETGRKTLQLSRKIARIFDDYQVYRPDMLSAWSGHAPLNTGMKSPAGPAGSHREWQARLWKEMTQEAVPLSDRLESLLAGKNDLSPMPQRISLFGVSSMPPRFLEAFAALGRTSEIFLFLLTPSNQFFFDLKSKRQVEKQALADHDSTGDDPSGEEFSPLFTGSEDEANPLLAALGRSGREFHGILENFDYHEPFGELFSDPLDAGDSSMLAVIQSDILNLVHRRRQGEYQPVPVTDEDNSLSVHACHSPMREAQVLKDILLDAFNTCPGLKPHDVIVMMPDIEAYAPFLEAVFAQAPRIPYTVSDRRKRSESRTLDAFLKLLDLRDSRFEKSKVMDLLLSPVISARFGLSLEDQERIDEALASAGVLWGEDASHRERLLDHGFFENSWAFGIQRLMAGFAMPGGEDAMIRDVLPWDGFEGLDADILGRFCHFTSTLFQGLKALDHPKSPEEWGGCLKKLVKSMLETAHGNEGDIGFLLTSIDEMVTQAGGAGFRRKLEFAVIREILENQLDQSISQGSFLAGSLTLCNLMPMRSIPFKVVCLMGMDEQGFPRQSRAQGFDLMAAGPRPGDKQEREEDCYLFLESLLSARERLIITYTGMSISDNSPIPCAGPVAELIDAITAGFTFPKGYTWQVFHPLHPFSPGYFDPLKQPDGLYSYSRPQCRIALAQEKQKAGSGRGAFTFLPGQNGAEEGKTDPSPGQPFLIDLSDLIRFFRHPVRDFISRTLGIAYPEPEEKGTDREVFQVSGLDQYHLGTAGVNLGDEAGTYSLMRGRGLLPFGEKGRTEWERIRELAEPVRRLATETIPDEKPSGLELDLEFDTFRISGRIEDVYSSGRYVKGFGAITPVRLLDQWISHLFYSLGAEISGQTWLIGRDPKNAKKAKACGFSPLGGEAEEILRSLAELYRSGREQVLPFLPVPCFYLVESLAVQGGGISAEAVEKALDRARPYWTGNQFMPGEKQNRYTALAFGSLDPFSGRKTLEASGLLDTGLSVFTPLLENLIP